MSGRIATAGFRQRKGERGAVLVELAIVLPVMLLLFGATAEFGRYFYEYSTLAKSTRLGARFLSTAASNGSDDAVAKNLVVYGNAAGTGSPILPGLTTTNIVITRFGGVSAIPAFVKIGVTGFTHQPVFDIGKMLNSATFTMSVDVKPSTTMRYLIYDPSV
jgi:Flp pilus assembly protein TadG